MELKSFFANSIEEAIRLARQELGPDAMLVNSKRTSVEAQHLGFYEVVVCSDGEDAGAGGAHSPKRLPEHGQDGPQRAASLPADQLSQELSEIKQQMEKLALTLGRSRRGAASVAFDPDLSRAFTSLTDAELDTELAYDVVGRLGAPVSEAGLRRELAKLLRVDAELGVADAPARVVALVGPPGSGKTSALVKLAVQYGLARGNGVRVLTADTFRIAAAEELRSYAAILGIGCQVLETPAALARALTECSKNDSRGSDPVLRSSDLLLRSGDLILIDTPGLCQSELEASDDLAAILATHPIGVDTHLVLPASMRAADLRRISEQYGMFHPRKLLFTRLDETETFGPLLSRSARLGIPVSFLSRGQRIPEDLEPATSDVLLDLILGRPALEAATEEAGERANENAPAEKRMRVERAMLAGKVFQDAPKFGVAVAGNHAA